MATTTARGALPDALAHAGPPDLTDEDRISLLRFILLMRATEERALTLYRQG